MSNKVYTIDRQQSSGNVPVPAGGRKTSHAVKLCRQSVKELATTRILEGAKVLPVVQVAHLWQESVYIGIAPRLLRMRVYPAVQNENDGFEAADF